MMVAPQAAESALSDRLQRYGRYVALVAEQLEALRNGDHEKLGRLRAEGEEIEASLAVEDGEPSENPLLPLLQDALQVGLSELAESFDSDLVSREQWARINDGALRSARSVPAPRIATRGYPELSKPSSRVDLRF